jgi:HAD superfamily hydrolase (TIGR01549 family)
MTPRAVIFDLDQTLVDSRALEDLRDSSRWREAIGRVSETVAYEGINELLLWLRSRSIKVGIVTNAPSNYCRAVLNHHSWQFDSTICWHDTAKHKPDPEPFLAALDRMNLSAAHTISVGDHVNDLLASSSARVTAYLATWGGAKQQSGRHVCGSVAEFAARCTSLIESTDDAADANALEALWRAVSAKTPDVEYSRLMLQVEDHAQGARGNVANVLGHMSAIDLIPGGSLAALRWLHTAAEREHPDAQFTLGAWCLAGRSSVRDRKKALMWFRRAAENGNERAIESLRKLSPLPSAQVGAQAARGSKAPRAPTTRAKRDPFQVLSTSCRELPNAEVFGKQHYVALDSYVPAKYGGSGHSDCILDLKGNGSGSRKYFEHLLKHIDASGYDVVCIAPSHDPGKSSAGLASLCSLLANRCGISDGAGWIVRSRKVTKAAYARSKSNRPTADTHCDSTEVKAELVEALQGKSILFVDDVITLSATFDGIRKMLQRSVRPACVDGLFLAKTRKPTGASSRKESCL